MTGARVELPEGLPEPWTEAGDAQRAWEQDNIHFPHQMSMLDFDFTRFTVDPGSNAVAERFDAPFGLASRRFWTRYYFHEPLKCEPSELERWWKTRTRAAFGPVLADLETHWDTVWFPELSAHQEFWSTFDLEGASTAALLAHLDETLERILRVWEVHFEIVFAVAQGWDAYRELYDELFEPTSALESVALLQGFPNRTVEAGHAIWRLSEIAARTPEALRILAESHPAEALTDLSETPAAAELVLALREYLDEFGRRGPHLGVSAKTFREDPAPVIGMLKDSLSRPDGDPNKHLQGRVAERERLVAAAKTALRHYPQPLREEFDRRLATAQTATRLKEDHNSIIDYECSAAVRRVLVEVANRLASAGALAAAEDMQHLTLAELRAALAELEDEDRPSIAAVAPADARPTDLRFLVNERKAELEHYAAVMLPERIGQTPPAAAAPAEPTEAGPGQLKGVGVSAGVARGRVRVILHLAEAGSLKPGEVLVAPTTSQPLTPLFATAAALVTEAGGVLSHVALIAREYRLPTVAGLAEATKNLRDGMLVEVDGAAGTVTILDEA